MLVLLLIDKWSDELIVVGKNEINCNVDLPISEKKVMLDEPSIRATEGALSCRN